MSWKLLQVKLILTGDSYQTFCFNPYVLALKPIRCQLWQCIQPLVQTATLLWDHVFICSETTRQRSVTRHDRLSKSILQGTLEGGRRRGRQRKCRMDNIKEWTPLPMPELLTKASCRKKTWRGSLLNRPSCPTDDPPGQGHWTVWNFLLKPSLCIFM